jgi:hypothetical protein
MACGGQKIDLGGTNTTSAPSVVAQGDQGEAGPSSSATDAGPPGAIPCTIPPSASLGIPAQDAGASLTPIDGTWSGNLDGADAGGADMAAVLTFAAAADGSKAGTVKFGTGAAPVFDPKSGMESEQMQPFPYDGFTYTATHVRFDGTTLSFTLVRAELGLGWCAGQTSFSTAPLIQNGCSCAPDWPAMLGTSGYELQDPTTGQWVPYSGDIQVYWDCAERGMVGPSCYCFSTGCTVDMSASDAVISLTLTPGHLDGTLSVLAGAYVPSTIVEPLHLVMK